MKSLLLALALLAGGLYVIYREFAIEPVPIVQIVTLGAAAASIGVLWLFWRACRVGS
jgi:hypothetical protein